MVDQTLATLQRKAKQRFRENAALRWFCNQNPADELTVKEKADDQIKIMSKRELQQFISTARKKSEELRRFYGIRSTAVIVKLFEQISHSQDDGIFCLPADFIRNICSNYNRVSKGFDDLPAHAAIAPGICVADRTMLVYLLERVAFGDMSALFNLWKQQKVPIESRADHKKLKCFEALGRAVATSAFNFLEAYLNGLAFDYLIRNWDILRTSRGQKTTCPECKRSSRKSPTTDKEKNEQRRRAIKRDLSERDEDEDREKFLSLRDKFKKYPRNGIKLTRNFFGQ